MNDDFELDIAAKKDELSLKAKGAGLIVLIIVCVVTIGVLAVVAMGAESGTSAIAVIPIMWLFYVIHDLISTLDALFGIRSRYRS